MKHYLICQCFLLVLSLFSSAQNEFQEPEKDRIFERFSEMYKLQLFEMPKEFVDYMAQNWEILFSDVERLKQISTSNGQPSEYVTVAIIAEATQRLPGLEYLEVLGKLLDLTEAGSIPRDIVLLRIGGEDHKYKFISVYFAYPRVARILERAKKSSRTTRKPLAISMISQTDLWQIVTKMEWEMTFRCQRLCPVSNSGGHSDR